MHRIKHNNKMNFKLTFLIFFITVSTFAQKATITGVVSDKDLNNEPLPFANVAIKGKSIGTTTDISGTYKLEVPAGNHVLVFSFLGYVSKEVAVSVSASDSKIINESLGTGSVKMEDVVVKASQKGREKESALLLDQKKAVEIKQSIGAQELSRKGVSDVEEGLTKVTGFAKVESRGLIVRGLEERYSNLLINELQAPSNSPFKKIIPLNLFPTDIVGVLNVYKTFNPNIPGDFAGATINLETSQPKSITKLSTSFGFVTQNNGQKFLISEDANTTQGFLGFLAKDRALPAMYGEKISTLKFQTPDQNASFGRQNSWNVDNSSSPINSGLSFLHSEKFSLNNNKNISYLFSINTDNNYQIRKGVDRTFNQGQGNYDNNLVTSTYNYNTSFSVLGGVKYKSNRFGVALNSFLLRSTTSTIQDQLGYTNSLNTNPNILIRLNQFEESRYWNNQLLFNYDITENKKHTLKAGVSVVKTSFLQPDRKFITGELQPNKTDISFKYGGNNFLRQFLDVSGDRYGSAMLEYTLVLKEKENGKINKIAFGYNGFSSEEISSYRFLSNNPILSNAPFIIADANELNDIYNTDVNNGIIKANREESGEDYRSKLHQNINSGYTNAFFTLGNKWEFNGGVRVENSVREIRFRRLGSGSYSAKFKKIDDNNLDVLPSINVKYELNEKSNMRLAASQTITRPTSSELLPIQYINGDGTVELGNNPLSKTINGPENTWRTLKNSNNTNIDLKYEFFPDNGEMFVIGAFGKQIKNPIERIFIPTASSGGQIITYDNSKSAILYGVELEALFKLNRLTAALNNFTFGFNTSLMKTKVEVDLINNPIENNKSRELQGAANWVVNSDLKYEFEFNEEMRNTISLVYGVAGDRIFAVGTAGIDHIYEKPFHKIDFVWTSKLSKNIEAKFAAENILNPTFKRQLGNESIQPITETDLTVRSFKRGTGLSLNVSYTF